MRWGLQKVIVFLADVLPGLAFLSMGGFLIWQYTMSQPPAKFEFMDLLKPVGVTFIVLVILHVLIAVILPLRWNTIRAQFHEQLQKRLRIELETHYHLLLTDIVNEVHAERRQNENFLKEIAEVGKWLAEREQAASIVNLYGK
jgi:hypothetical protein